MTEQLLFWLAVGAGAGFVLANTWDTILFALVILAIAWGDGNIGGGPDLKGPEIFRWFVRTFGTILAATIAFLYLGITERWETLNAMGSEGEVNKTWILFASSIMGILVTVVTIWLNPIGRILQMVAPDER